MTGTVARTLGTSRVICCPGPRGRLRVDARKSHKEETRRYKHAQRRSSSLCLFRGF